MNKTLSQSGTSVPLEFPKTLQDAVPRSPVPEMNSIIRLGYVPTQRPMEFSMLKDQGGCTNCSFMNNLAWIKTGITVKIFVSKLVDNQKKNNHNTFVFKVIIRAIIMVGDMGLFSRFCSMKDTKCEEIDRTISLAIIQKWWREKVYCLCNYWFTMYNTWSEYLINVYWMNDKKIWPLCICIRFLLAKPSLSLGGKSKQKT